MPTLKASLHNPAFARSTAIVGIGQTAYSRRSDREEVDLALEAVRTAALDAGLDLAEIDGIVRYSQDRVIESTVTEALGLALNYHGQVGYGGQSAGAVVTQAAAAIHAGLASTVVCYRALNGRTAVRYGSADRVLEQNAGDQIARGTRVPAGAFSGPYGLQTPGQVMALWARRYAHEAGIEIDTLSSALCRIAVDQRQYANRNPHAVMRDKPLDTTTYLGAKLIADPLRLFDFCLETDGAAAIILTSAERARSLRQEPVFVLGGSQGLYAEAMEVYTELVNGPQHRRSAVRLFQSCGLSTSDIDVAMLYDANTIMVLLQLEGYGFIEPGRAWAALMDHGIGIDSPLPVNTSGGQLSEAYVHGMNLVIEAVRQLRGTSTSPVADAKTALVGAAGASSVVLSR